MAIVNARRARADRYKWIERLSRRLRLDGDQWHDGRLVELSFRTGSQRTRKPAEVRLRVEIYGDETNARTRTPLTITFGDAQELISTVNLAELAGQADDQIAFARLKETSQTLDLSIYLVGGHVRVVAGRLTVAAPRAKR
jgi:hypothetical protein